MHGHTATGCHIQTYARTCTCARLYPFHNFQPHADRSNDCQLSALAAKAFSFRLLFRQSAWGGPVRGGTWPTSLLHERPSRQQVYGCCICMHGVVGMPGALPATCSCRRADEYVGQPALCKQSTTQSRRRTCKSHLCVQHIAQPRLGPDLT